MSDESAARIQRTAISIIARVALPMVAAMWVLAELAQGLVVSEMAWPALLIACVLIFVGFNQAIGIADSQLNDLPEDVIGYD